MGRPILQCEIPPPPSSLELYPSGGGGVGFLDWVNGWTAAQVTG